MPDETGQNESAGSTVKPPLPAKTGGPGQNWKHNNVRQRVLSTIYAVQGHFETSLNIEGVLATDLFTLNTTLGASIEQSFVDCLNDLRDVWDIDKSYSKYRFVRQAQTFPDVLLTTDDPQVASSDRIIMGIELKGWFVLSKEGEPSFRYKVTPGACASQDLLVVVPWMFSNVISGAPALLRPIVTEAKYAAEMRNYWWEFVRESKDPVDKRGVALAVHQAHYPNKNDKSSDVPIKDSGSNFGRVSRIGVFDSDIDSTMEILALGIPLKHWLHFLQLFTDSSDSETIARGLQRLSAELGVKLKLSKEKQAELVAAFQHIAEAIK